MENGYLLPEGYFIASQQLAQYFIRQGHGNAVNISSIYCVVAPCFKIYETTRTTIPSKYVMNKSGLIHLTTSKAKYCKHKNIRFNCINPGCIDSKNIIVDDGWTL